MGKAEEPEEDLAHGLRFYPHTKINTFLNRLISTQASTCFNQKTDRIILELLLSICVFFRRV